MSQRTQPHTSAPHPVLDKWYSEPTERQAFVDDLFDRGAKHYDAVCQTMSFGSGRWYRRDAFKRAGLEPGMRLLDVASGTGQVLEGALKLGLDRKDVVGLDPSRGMLRENLARTNAHLVRGVGERLPFADGSFDFLSMGYALRHVPDLETAFAEYARVLKPDGKVLILEITKPKSKTGRFFTKAFMKTVVPVLARVRTRSRDASELMKYYWETINACVPPEEILAALRATGFEACDWTRKQGILSEYTATRPGVEATKIIPRPEGAPTTAASPSAPAAPSAAQPRQ